jgi:hypothetical protein
MAEHEQQFIDISQTGNDPLAPYLRMGRIVPLLGLKQANLVTISEPTK